VAQNTQAAPEPVLDNPKAPSAYRMLKNHSTPKFLLSLRWLRRFARRTVWRVEQRRAVAGCQNEKDAIELIRRVVLTPQTADQFKPVAGGEK
jgi:hypothetical protein